MKRVRMPAIVTLVVFAFGIVVLGCGSDTQTHQQQLNSVMVGSFDVLSRDDSAAVSAIGLELVALGEPLREWFDGTEDHQVLLDRMTAAVDRIEARLTPDRAAAVRSTFQPYVNTWRDILAALKAGDISAYDTAVARIRQFDDERIARVVDVYGEEEAQHLLKEEGVDPNR
jgi:hypothetical protein